MADIKELFKDELITSPEKVRKPLGFSKNKMYEILENDKTFPAWREGSKWCINVSQLQEWIDSKTKKKR